jgi:GT2 family glycosyltransferase
VLTEAIISARFVEDNHELIVVDNGSVDGTVQKITGLFPGVKLIENKHNAGFSEANNQGFEIAGGKYILLLNPDAKLINHDIAKALNFLKSQPQTIIGPRILNPDGSLQQSVIPVASALSILTEAFFLSYLLRQDTETLLKKENYALSGACLLMNREIYNDLKGLDKDLFWMEDVDFCVRAKKNGINLHYFKEWEIIHLMGQSGKKNYKVSIANQLISKLKYFKKREMHADFVFSVVFTQVHILLRIPLFLLLSVFGRKYRLKFLAYCYTQTLFLRFIFTGKKRTF